jgi:hypothetical protein
MMQRLPRLVSMALACATVLSAAAAVPTPGLIPLNTLSNGTYQGFTGGLYAEGRNEPWGAHSGALKRMSEAVHPLDRDGKPDARGKIVIVGIGASVCKQVFDELEAVAPKTRGISPSVVFVNCAKGGHDVNKISDPERQYWEAAKAAVVKAGFAPAQAQVAWYQSDELVDSRADFPGRPQRLQEAIAKNMRELKHHFPNVRVCYHSARHTTAFSPDKGAKAKHGEPRPYHVGWSVKWLIEQQASGSDGLRFEGKGAVAPLIGWATYFWTNADRPRNDGYQWTREMNVADGIHLTVAGKSRVAGELLDFWRSDPYARNWFAAGAAEPFPVKTAGAATAQKVFTKSDDPRDPAWIINGNNKIPKLQRLLGTTDNVRVVVRDVQGKQVLEIKDVFRKRSNLNELVPHGEYRLEFFDKDGKTIKLTQEVGEILRLK